MPFEAKRTSASIEIRISPFAASLSWARAHGFPSHPSGKGEPCLILNRESPRAVDLINS